MILITDSGSTKTNWIAVGSDGNIKFRTETAGLNPAVFEKKLLKKRIGKNEALITHKDEISKVFFYGAGCGTKKPRELIYEILKSTFKHAEIIVKEDTEAAIFSVTTTPAIVCILGTGSNCSYYDGTKIHQKIISLGYAVMDDASGNYFGRILLRDFFYHKMPKDFSDGFKLDYDLSADEIKKNLYKKENPNTYLANFSHYLVHHKNTQYAQRILEKGIIQFVENHILQYPESSKLPIHFIGSLAFFIQDEIKNVLKKYHLKIGKFERHPIEGLVNYHINKEA